MSDIYQRERRLRRKSLTHCVAEVSTRDQSYNIRIRGTFPFHLGKLEADIETAEACCFLGRGPGALSGIDESELHKQSLFLQRYQPFHQNRVHGQHGPLENPKTYHKVIIDYFLFRVRFADCLVI